MRVAPPVPTTSIFSRSDGIVAWRCSLNEPGPLAENVEVPASHVGMGMNPTALYAIADRLAQPIGQWKPFEVSGRAALVLPHRHARADDGRRGPMSRRAPRPPLMQISANGIALEIEDHGSPQGEPLLLIMGLGMQLLGWHEDFVASLVARGFRVIRFDNRDIGLSQGFDAAGVPNLALDFPALRPRPAREEPVHPRRHGGRQRRRARRRSASTRPTSAARRWAA